MNRLDTVLVLETLLRKFLVLTSRTRFTLRPLIRVFFSFFLRRSNILDRKIYVSVVCFDRVLKNSYDTKEDLGLSRSRDLYRRATFTTTLVPTDRGVVSSEIFQRLTYNDGWFLR